MEPIAGWTVNAADLRKALAEVTHQPIDTVAVDVALGIAVRLAHECGQKEVITDRDLYEASQRALEELTSETPGYHYLEADRKSAAATLLAIRKILQPNSNTPDIHSVIESDESWKAYLGSFDSPEMNFLVAGWEMLTDQWQGIKNAVWAGPLIMSLPFESVDIRFNTLMRRAIAVGRKIFAPEPLWQLKTLSFAKRGLPTPPTREQATTSIEFIEAAMQEHSSDGALLEHLRKHDPFREHVETLFRFIAAFGGRDIAKPAAEVLAVLHTNIFEKRAAAPIGEKTLHFPKIDGQNREEVLPFLRKLVPQLWEKPDDTPRVRRWLQQRMEKAAYRFTERIWAAAERLINRMWPLLQLEDTGLKDDEIWQIWNDTWNLTELNVGDIITDLDDVLWNWRMPGMPYGDFSHENVWLRTLIVSYLALALRDQTPIPFASHTASTRLADIANTPKLAAVRLALFLRTQSDPDVTLEEIEGIPGRYTYGQLALDQEDDLREFEEAKFDFEKLDPKTQVHVALNLVSGFKDYVRGSKGLASDAKRILIDDSMTKARHYVLGGGLGAVVTNEHDFHPVYLLRVTALAKKLTAQYQSRIILDISEGNGHKHTTKYIENAISHTGSQIAIDYREPTVTLATRRLRINRALNAQKLYDKVMGEAKAIIARIEYDVLTFRVEQDVEGNFVLIQETGEDKEKKTRRLTVRQKPDGEVELLENGFPTHIKPPILVPVREHLQLTVRNTPPPSVPRAGTPPGSPVRSETTRRPEDDGTPRASTQSSGNTLLATIPDMDESGDNPQAESLNFQIVGVSEYNQAQPVFSIVGAQSEVTTETVSAENSEGYQPDNTSQNQNPLPLSIAGARTQGIMRSTPFIFRVMK